MKQEGFTLIEIIVALSIFSILSVMAFTGLNSVLSVQGIMESKGQHISSLQFTFKFMQRDLNQAITRTVRDQYGQYQPMFKSDGDKVLTFTNSAARNPANAIRSALQRVSYQIKDNQLYRHSWRQLDGASDADSRDLLLLKEVKYIEWKFLKQNNEWSNQWPPINVELEDTGLPRAVSILIDSELYGDIYRIFLLPQ